MFITDQVTPQCSAIARPSCCDTVRCARHAGQGVHGQGVLTLLPHDAVGPVDMHPNVKCLVDDAEHVHDRGRVQVTGSHRPPCIVGNTVVDELHGPSFGLHNP